MPLFLTLFHPFSARHPKSRVSPNPRENSSLGSPPPHRQPLSHIPPTSEKSSMLSSQALRAPPTPAWYVRPHCRVLGQLPQCVLNFHAAESPGDLVKM